MPPLAGVEFIHGDFAKPAAGQLEALLTATGRPCASDMAPNMSGMDAVDQPRAMYLAELAAIRAGTPAARWQLLIKLFQAQALMNTSATCVACTGRSGASRKRHAADLPRSMRWQPTNDRPGCGQGIENERSGEESGVVGGHRRGVDGGVPELTPRTTTAQGLSYSEFLTQVRCAREQVVFSENGRELTGTTKDGGKFTVSLPPNDPS